MSATRHKTRASRGLSASLSLDCLYMLLRTDSSVRIYEIAQAQSYHGRSGSLRASLEIPRPTGPRSDFRGASLGRAICATITNSSCSIHRYIGIEEHKQIYLASSDTWKISCVAVSEATAMGDLAFVAIGLQNDHSDFGKIKIFSLWQNDWGECTEVKTMILRDRATNVDDSPKSLAFSLDGAILTCTTQGNQVHAWQLPTVTETRSIRKICEVTRPFNIVRINMIYK
jgi:hypothetical protein